MTVATDPLHPSADDPQAILDVAGPDVCDQNALINDPPPPYPSPGRDRRHRTSPRPPRRILVQRIQTSHHQQLSSDSQQEPATPLSPVFQADDGFVEPTEHTLLLAPAISRRAGGRPRSYSHASTASAAPSLAQNVFSLFQTEDEFDPNNDADEGSYLSPQETHGNSAADSRRQPGFFSAWKRYFKPLGRKVYYSSLLHLMVINFPYALLAWVYLFVFTVTGTTLLVALPLGAVLCFFNLLGARTFSRGELALQYRFHRPLSHPAPYPPRPIFTRYREPIESEIESGRTSERRLVRETSFYKNTYAMFTDPTSYQALFYFLVIKPAITLILTILVWAFAFPLLLLVLPAPAVLRAIRRLGKWQANVAIEGLYLAVR